MTLTQVYTGRTRYLARHEVGPHTLLVAISCSPGDLPGGGVALLDTAAEWCVLPRPLAEELGVADGAGPAIRLNTRFGTFHGTLERLPVRFLAATGESVIVEATWFVSPEWPGPVVLGWVGCLQRVRFALDPAGEDFYFASL